MTAAAAIRYAAIGASDAVGVGASDPATGSWPARLSRRLPAGTVYTNTGVGGSLTEQALLEQLPGALRARPTLVTAWLAVNDLNAEVDVATYGRSLGALIDALVGGTEARVFVGNVPDLRAVPAYATLDQNALLARIGAYNAAIAAIAAKSPGRVSVVDLFAGSADLVTRFVLSPDGFHPSDAGYELITDRFASSLRAKGVPISRT